MSGLFHEEGMENIQVIPKARIPIIKFKDPRSGLDVDISLDNRLAIHNSMMLKSYAQEERLQRLIQMVKYWASRRGINNAFEGTETPASRLSFFSNIFAPKNSISPTAKE